MHRTLLVYLFLAIYLSINKLAGDQLTIRRGYRCISSNQQTIVI